MDDWPLGPPELITLGFIEAPRARITREAGIPAGNEQARGTSISFFAEQGI